MRIMRSNREPRSRLVSGVPAKPRESPCRIAFNLCLGGSNALLVENIIVVSHEAPRASRRDKPAHIGSPELVDVSSVGEKQHWLVHEFKLVVPEKACSILL